MANRRQPMAEGKGQIADGRGQRAECGWGRNGSVMAGRARHSVRAGLGSGAYGGAHGVTRPTFPAVTEALPGASNRGLTARDWAIRLAQMLKNARQVGLVVVVSGEAVGACRP